MKMWHWLKSLADGRIPKGRQRKSPDVVTEVKPPCQTPADIGIHQTFLNPRGLHLVDFITQQTYRSETSVQVHLLWILSTVILKYDPLVFAWQVRSLQPSRFSKTHNYRLIAGWHLKHDAWHDRAKHNVTPIHIYFIEVTISTISLCPTVRLTLVRTIGLTFPSVCRGGGFKIRWMREIKIKKRFMNKKCKVTEWQKHIVDPALHPLFPAAVLSHNATLYSPMQGRSQDSEDTEVLPPHPHPYIETTLKTIVYIISISLHFDRKIDR